MRAWQDKYERRVSEVLRALIGLLPKTGNNSHSLKNRDLSDAYYYYSQVQAQPHLALLDASQISSFRDQYKGVFFLRVNPYLSFFIAYSSFIFTTKSFLSKYFSSHGLLSEFPKPTPCRFLKKWLLTCT